MPTQITSLSEVGEQPAKEFEDFDKLPPELENIRTVENLMDGAVAYVVPWALWVDNERRCFVNGKYNYTDSPQGTATMKVSREGDRVVVFMNTVSEEDQRLFGRKSQPPHQGALPDEYIPVVFRKKKD